VGGCVNTASALYSVVLGGVGNTAAANFSSVVGCGINANVECAFHTNRLVIVNVPTSSAGLSSGEVWSDGGTLKIIP
jgi:hypothetical protein